ncbi:hypothetical protein RI367_002519 [Sorochytrium milnesiophthora]
MNVVGGAPTARKRSHPFLTQPARHAAHAERKAAEASEKRAAAVQRSLAHLLSTVYASTAGVAATAAAQRTLTAEDLRLAKRGEGDAEALWTLCMRLLGVSDQDDADKELKRQGYPRLGALWQSGRSSRECLLLLAYLCHRQQVVEQSVQAALRDKLCIPMLQQFHGASGNDDHDNKVAQLQQRKHLCFGPIVAQQLAHSCDLLAREFHNLAVAYAAQLHSLNDTFTPLPVFASTGMCPSPADYYNSRGGGSDDVAMVANVLREWYRVSAKAHESKATWLRWMTSVVGNDRTAAEMPRRQVDATGLLDMARELQAVLDDARQELMGWMTRDAGVQQEYLVHGLMQSGQPLPRTVYMSRAALVGRFKTAAADTTIELAGQQWTRRSARDVIAELQRELSMT